MSNIIIAYRNWADDATLSGGSWEGTLPLSNLLDPQPSRMARSTGAYQSEGTINVDLTAVQPSRVIALIKHNFSQDAKWRVRLSDDNTFATSDYDSGWVDVWPTTVEFGSLNWGVFNWGQYMDAVEVASISRYAIMILDQVYVNRYLRIELDDENNADGYLQAGRLFVAAGWQPLSNMQYGWRAGHVDDTQESKSKGGQRWFESGAVRRTLDFTLRFMTSDEKEVADSISHTAGLSGAVLVIPLPHDEVAVLKQSVYGTMKVLGDAENWEFDLFKKDFSVEELI